MRLIWTLVFCCTCSTAALALESVETPLNTDQCQVLKKENRDHTGELLKKQDWWPSYWRCQGLGNRFVYISFDGEREQIGFGTRSTQTTGNTRHGRLGGWGPVVEWRGAKDATGALVPVAAIVKYKWIDPESETNAEDSDLSVIRLGKGKTDTCVVARVNMTANSDSLEIARKVADSEAASFVCREDAEPEYRGKTRP